MLGQHQCDKKKLPATLPATLRRHCGDIAATVMLPPMLPATSPAILPAMLPVSGDVGVFPAMLPAMVPCFRRCCRRQKSFRTQPTSLAWQSCWRKSLRRNSISAPTIRARRNSTFMPPCLFSQQGVQMNEVRSADDGWKLKSLARKMRRCEKGNPPRLASSRSTKSYISPPSNIVGNMQRSRQYSRQRRRQHGNVAGNMATLPATLPATLLATWQH